jgi:hypothetical protein
MTLSDKILDNETATSEFGDAILLEHDVKEAIKELKAKIRILEPFVSPSIMWIDEVFGKELCE